MRKIVLAFLAVVMASGFVIQTSFGTPQIAKQTDKSCKECHFKSDNGNGGGGPHANGPGGNRNK